MDLSSEIYHALLPAFLTVTLGLPVAAMGAIDGVAEATANMAKLVSGRLSDRSRRRKPWILLGYGMAALSKPLFPLADGRDPDPWRAFRRPHRQGHSRRAARRDDRRRNPARLRGAAFGLRQSLDTVGAFLAPLAAIGLMAWFAGDIRAVFWVATIPALLSFLVAWLTLRESRTQAVLDVQDEAGGLPRHRPGDPAADPGRLCCSRWRDFREGFLILRALDVGVSATWSPLVLVVFNLAFGLSPIRPARLPTGSARERLCWPASAC